MTDAAYRLRPAKAWFAPVTADVTVAVFQLPPLYAASTAPQSRERASPHRSLTQVQPPRPGELGARG